MRIKGNGKRYFYACVPFAICVLLCKSEFYAIKIYYVKFVNIRT